MKHTFRWSLLAAIMVLLAVVGCKKKPQAPPAPPPPPPSAPTASLTATPATIDKGQAATLSWRTENAADVRIEPGLGKVDGSGERRVTPDESTTYRLTATGPGGTQEATARVTVQAPAPPPPAATTGGNETLEQSFQQNVHDIFFDYDSYTLRSDAQSTVQANAAWFKQHPEAKVTIQGHCDERGSTEYNLTLGDNRAHATKDALVQMGVPANQLNTISFGKEKPFCTESSEQCWQQNRRAHFVLGSAPSGSGR